MDDDSFRRFVVARTRSRVRELLGHETVETAVGDGTADCETTVLMRQALARLTARQRAVLVLRYYEDLTEPQVAALMGTSVGTVKSQVRHALARLRQLAPELSELAPCSRLADERPVDLLEQEASS